MVIKQIANSYLGNMSLANEYLVNSLNERQMSVSCIEFDLTQDLTITIEKLCIKSPYADVVINDAIITWELSTAEFMTSSINSIEIESMVIVGSNAIEFVSEPTDNSNDKNFQISETPKLITTLMESMTQLSIPTSLQIKQLTYQPYIAPSSTAQNLDDNNKVKFQGKLSIDDNKVDFILSNDEEVQILSIGLTPKNKVFQAKVSTNIAEMAKFLLIHNIPLPPALVTKNKDADLQGQFISDLYWRDKELTINSQLTDLSFNISSLNTSVNDELNNVSLDANLDWETRLVDNVLTFDFKDNSHFKLLADKEELVVFLSQKQLPDSAISIVKDNNLAKFLINPAGLITVDFSTQKIIVDKLMINDLSLIDVSKSSVSMNKPGENKLDGSTPFALLLSGIEFTYKQNINGTHVTNVVVDATQADSTSSVSTTLVSSNSNTITAALKKAKFSLETELVLSALEPFQRKSVSNEPVSMQAYGSLTHKNDTWEVILDPSTKIKLSHLSMPLLKSANDKENKVKDSKVKESAPKGIKVAELTSFWQGKISIDANASFNLALASNNQIKNLAFSNILQVEDTKITVDIAGNLEDITLNSELITDNVSLGKLNVRGNVYQPQIKLSANEVSVTDLLALKVKLPIELKLIDGTLSYQLSGQLNDFKKDFSQVVNSSMALSLSLESITGEIDGKWLQDINWQQNFNIDNQKIASVPSTVANFSIDKIETATPITGLSMNTEMSFEKGDLKVKVNNVYGKLLGGSFTVESAVWPLVKEHSVNVQLETIDLEQLLELDKKQGIVVTGKISGNLPLFTDGKAFLIEAGELHNVGDGVIQVFNNPAVEELKSSGTQLKLAFDALENLHYHHLYSNVSMADDGYMLLDTVIKGVNPDLGNDVNLNLNLSYDLLGLLESLNITEQFESKMVQGLQNN
jgi:hypothetical protein